MDHIQPRSMNGRHQNEARLVFVTGATGYIGGRLVPLLLENGYTVRCLARNRSKLAARSWSDDPGVELLEGDVGDTELLTQQMTGCVAAYYLVHSMIAAGDDYAERDRLLASSFAAAASRAGLRRIVYLGGLGDYEEALSEHLRSRREVESALAETDVPVTVLRAAMIIGSGSTSFEILRYLVERLPVMVTPRWVRTEAQPIGVGDVLDCLVRCLDREDTAGAALEIGGADVRSYRELMATTAEALGLRRRLIVPVPVLTPRLSSLWIHLVTPLDHRIAQPLAEGLRNRVVCQDNRAPDLLGRQPLSCRQAIELAVSRSLDNAVETSWSDAGPIPGDPDWAGGTSFIDERQIVIEASPAATFRAVTRIGGGHGWYAADYLWRLRGLLDQLVGGPGLRRGRRHPDRLGYGDALDFWRVTGIEQDRCLALRAEMRLPGEALLAFEIEPLEPLRCRLRQTARFLPRGLFGLLYWYAVLPLHGIVFSGMLNGIKRSAERAGDAGTAAGG